MRPSTQLNLDALDRQIVMGLAMRSTPGNEAIVLSDLDSLDFLKTILKTKRAFWARSKEHAIRPGKSIPGELLWRQYSETFQPKVQPLTGPGHVLATTPPAYFDPETNEIGSLKFNVPGPVVARWASSPAMSLEAAHKWFSRLKKDYPEAPLPPPDQLDVNMFQGQPQAQLTIRTCLPAFENSDKKTEIVPLSQTITLELAFIYGNRTFNWDDECLKTAIYQNGTVETIHRDAAFENNMVQQLASIGILPENSAASFGLLALNSRKFTFSEEIKQPFDQYLKKRFPTFVQENNIMLIDTIQLLEKDFTSDIDIELESNADATFKLSVKDQQSQKPIDLVQLLKNYLCTLPDTPLDILLEQIEKQAFTLFKKGSGQTIVIPGHQVAPLVSVLLEIMIQTDSKPEHIPLRLAAQLAIKGDKDAAGYSMEVVPKTLIEYLIAWSQQPLPQAVPATAPHFKATLRAYQATGVAWLARVINSGYGAILADEMGLGKTVQTLALLNKLSATTTKPTLLIAPSSLISTWHDEAGKFTPELKTYVQHGSERATGSATFKDYALVITSYALLRRDADIYHGVDWYGVILDEAHFVKNSRTKTYRAIEQIDADWRLCLTGTPVENHLNDLFSLFQLTVPGYLGRVSDWKKSARTSTRNAWSDNAIAQLKQEIAPFILRRTKEEVLTELPPKTETLVPLELQPEEYNAYNTILAATDKTIRNEIQRRGFAQSSITILNCLLRLRQCCCDPTLIEHFEDNSKHAPSARKHSTKTQHLLDWLPELIRQNHKVLIFSSFAQYLQKLSQALGAGGLNHSLLTGSTTDRDKEIQKFRCGENNIFLLSLKAGGYGLTLTEADIVVHCDPWWNPAVEAQASARIHRIGQEKPVFIYKLVAEDTIESRILELQEEKRGLADRLLSQDQETWKLDENILRELLEH